MTNNKRTAQQARSAALQVKHDSFKKAEQTLARFKKQGLSGFSWNDTNSTFVPPSISGQQYK